MCKTSCGAYLSKARRPGPAAGGTGESVYPGYFFAAVTCSSLSIPDASSTRKG